MSAGQNQPRRATPHTPPGASQPGSGVRFGFAQAGDALAILPLTPLFEHFQALKALEHISFAAQSGGGAQTAML